MKNYKIFYLFSVFCVFLALLIYFDLISGIGEKEKQMLIYFEVISAIILFSVGKFISSKSN